MLLVLIYCFLLIRLRFIGATISGWIIFALYFSSNYFFTGENTSVLTINYFFLLSANILGMFGGYVLEYYTRKEFYLRQLLKKEQEKVKNTNEYLEEKVKEKTFALQEDVEKRKQAEQKLMQLKDNLQEEVNKKTKELHERVSELEQFQDATIERELRMEELRKTIELLKKEKIKPND
jgi:alanyl-tRNA synthetase